MRFWTAILLCCWLMAGCSSTKSKERRPPKGTSPFTNQLNKASEKIIITPDPSVSGKVSSVNQEARFVVLTFGIGQLPAAAISLNAYRGGLKVGQLRVTGPQRDNNTVADILSGQIQKGDEVRQD